MVHAHDPEPVGGLADEFRKRTEALTRKSAAGDLPGRTEPPGPDLDELQRYAEVRWRQAIPARFVDAHVDQLSDPLRKLADEWTGEGCEANVLLLGAVGVGKTHAAVALARLAHEAGRSVLMLPVVELLESMRPGGDPHAKQRATSVDVLVLDDLGGERPTDWTGEQLYALVNRRYLECRPTIVTANLDREALEASVGARVYSRLYHDAKRLAIGGTDRRRAA